jgi:bacterioferritin (cytochrome b1)
MEAPDKKTIANLQTAAQLLAHLAGQYQVDVRQLKAMGLKWLACRVKKWYAASEDHLRKVIDRLLYFDADPEYDAGAVSGADTVEEVLQRAQDLVYAAHEQLVKFRAQAWEAQADYTPDVYEHAIHDLEHQAFKIERERALIKKLGEPGYIGARLEDA